MMGFADAVVNCLNGYNPLQLVENGYGIEDCCEPLLGSGWQPSCDTVCTS